MLGAVVGVPGDCEGMCYESWGRHHFSLRTKFRENPPESRDWKDLFWGVDTLRHRQSAEPGRWEASRILTQLRPPNQSVRVDLQLAPPIPTRKKLDNENASGGVQ